MAEFETVNLSERAQSVLIGLIRRHIDDGSPIGSRTLAKETDLALSSATIRNVMADLEELGLLYTRSRQRGVFVLPSLVRADSFDLILLNMEVAEVHQLLDSGLIHELSDERQNELGEVFL